MKTSGIILAAGNGKRFGDKKQFIKLNGKEIWEWSFETAKKVLDEVVIVGIDFDGGETRQKSVKIGLEHVTGDKVIIFDAARPLVSEKDINNILKKLDDKVSVSLSKPLTNTIYKLDGEYMRDNAYELLVPQGFITSFLEFAHKHTKIKNATDDTIIIKDIFNIKPTLIFGGENLHKLTYPKDLEILKNLCKKY